MSRTNWITNEAAFALIREHSIVDVTEHPAVYDFKLGDGRTLVFDPGSDDYAPSWGLE